MRIVAKMIQEEKQVREMHLHSVFSRATKRRENVGMVARERETGAMFGKVVPRKSTEELFLMKMDGVAPDHAVENSFDIDVKWIEEDRRAQNT